MVNKSAIDINTVWIRLSTVSLLQYIVISYPFYTKIRVETGILNIGQSWVGYYFHTEAITLNGLDKTPYDDSMLQSLPLITE